MKLEPLIKAFLLLTLASCASTHPGSKAQPSFLPSIPLVVSAEPIDPDFKAAYQLFEVTIENQSNDWFRIKHGDVLVDQPEKSKISTVTGRDLKDWATAKALELKKDQHNAEILQSTLMLTGAALSRSKDSAALGLAMVAGSTIWAVSDSIRMSLREAEKADEVPENHLGHSVGIPARMFQRRWVLLNKPPGQIINRLVIELESISGEKAQYVVKI